MLHLNVSFYLKARKVCVNLYVFTIKAFRTKKKNVFNWFQLATQICDKIKIQVKPKIFNSSYLLKASRTELKNPFGQAIEQEDAIIRHKFGILL
jgi:hypothetical protein